MRLLDLFCGAGGAAMGYHRAGFEVVGVDIKPQPHYPFEFHQADAIELLNDLIEGRWVRTAETAWAWDRDRFQAIHASPPCQHYSSATRDASLHPDLYAPTRDLLIASGLPYVIENVIGAPYSHGIVLCGSMFGLESEGEWLQRHRNFETSWLMFQPAHQHRTDRRAVTVTGKTFTSAMWQSHHSRQGPFALGKALMGIDWMNRRELPQAIPPAYTEWIGRQLLAALEVAA